MDCWQMQKNQNLWESDIQLVFQCDGTDVDNNIDEIKAIIGRDSLKQRH